MFSEDVVLGGLKAGPSWFIGDHLLRINSGTSDPGDVARQIADRNDLRYERAKIATNSNGFAAAEPNGLKIWLSGDPETQVIMGYISLRGEPLCRD